MGVAAKGAAAGCGLLALDALAVRDLQAAAAAGEAPAPTLAFNLRGSRSGDSP